MSVPAVIVKRRIKGVILSIIGIATAFIFLFPYRDWEDRKSVV